MSIHRRELHLNAFLMEAGHHEAAWRLSQSNPRADFDLRHWIELAQLAENAAAYYAQQAAYSADGVSLSFGPIGDALRAVAARLKNQYAMAAQAGVMVDAGGVSWGDGKIPGTRNFAFGMKMDDDPAAGQQDFGGDWPSVYNEGEWGAPGESGP